MKTFITTIKGTAKANNTVYSQSYKPEDLLRKVIQQSYLDSYREVFNPQPRVEYEFKYVPKQVSKFDNYARRIQLQQYLADQDYYATTPKRSRFEEAFALLDAYTKAKGIYSEQGYDYLIGNIPVKVYPTFIQIGYEIIRRNDANIYLLTLPEKKRATIEIVINNIYNTFNVA